MIDILTKILLDAEFSKDENTPHNRYILPLGDGLCEVWLTAKSWTFTVSDEDGDEIANFWSSFDHPTCIDALNDAIAEYCS